MPILRAKAKAKPSVFSQLLASLPNLAAQVFDHLRPGRRVCRQIVGGGAAEIHGVRRKHDIRRPHVRKLLRLDGKHEPDRAWRDGGADVQRLGAAR